jgi:hypothetical protein
MCDFAEDLLGILALESIRGGFVVVAKIWARWNGPFAKLNGNLEHRLLWFESGRSFPCPMSIRRNQQCPRPTICRRCRVWQGRDIERAAGLVDEKGISTNGLSAARARPVGRCAARAGFRRSAGICTGDSCALAIVNQEDLTGETEQQNLPASTAASQLAPKCGSRWRSVRWQRTAWRLERSGRL